MMMPRGSQLQADGDTRTKNKIVAVVLFTDLKCRLCGFIIQNTRDPFSSLFKQEAVADYHTHTYADNPAGRSGSARNNPPCSRRSACL